MATAQFIFDNAINKYIDNQNCITVIRDAPLIGKVTQFSINGTPLLDRKMTFAADIDFRQLPSKTALARIHYGGVREVSLINVRKIKWLNPDLEITVMAEYLTKRKKGIALIGPILLEFYDPMNFEAETFNGDFVWFNDVRKFAVQVLQYKNNSISIPQDFLARVAARFPELGGEVFRNMVILVVDQMKDLLTLPTGIKATYAPLNVDELVKQQRFH
ncbi:hypothetical protein BJ742DRAFT_868978 [Cladochytrium replicatum]|nr:hypothetical protein BJ742DRAFT_868978 [Cladochytrium replicatum]